MPSESKLRANADFDVDSLIVDRDKQFKVHTDCYTDPALFRTEMRRIFGGTWLYVGHESEIPSPGDYKTSHMGLQPVILSRTEDGEVRVLFNRCRHRAAVVCREAKGTANFFRCAYHGWVYGNDGRLKGVSMRKGAYDDDWEQPWGLQQPAKVEIFRGMIFASVREDVPPLRDYLGLAATWIGRQFDLAPSGQVELGYKPYVVEYPGNWKFVAENSLDGYHAMYVHDSFWKVQERFGAETGQHGSYVEGDTERVLEARSRAFNIGCRQGHGLARQPYPEESVGALFEGQFGDYFASLAERHGPDEFRRIISDQFTYVFPNVVVLHSQIRVIRPIAVDRTEVTIYPFALKDAPAERNVARLRGHERFYGPAGFGMPDDIEMFARNQQGLAAESVEWLLLERGLGREEILDSGDIKSRHVDETPQRALHRAWKHMMRQSADGI